VRHEVVHNRHVVERLRDMGAVFVEELDEVPDGATVIFSAHGVSRAVEDEAKRRGLNVFDATCPLVTKVHMEVRRFAREGRDVVLIGHEGHPEVEGTMGASMRASAGASCWSRRSRTCSASQVRDPARLASSRRPRCRSTTRRHRRGAAARFPELASPTKEDICYATQNRQDAVKRWCASATC
jgi:4-hydroxy-3-methylbut-2-enyl diphosphate reductase